MLELRSKWGVFSPHAPLTNWRRLIAKTRAGLVLPLQGLRPPFPPANPYLNDIELMLSLQDGDGPSPQEPALAVRFQDLFGRLVRDHDVFLAGSRRADGHNDQGTFAGSPLVGEVFDVGGQPVVLQVVQVRQM